MPSLLERAKLKLRSAQDAKTKEERAQERVRSAVNRIQLEAAREKLRTARVEREIKESQARVALEAARARVDMARVQSLKASEAKWQARYAKAGTMFGVVARPTASSAKLAGKGLKQVGDWLWAGEKPKRRRSRSTRMRAATVKRKVVVKTRKVATAKKRTVAKR